MDLMSFMEISVYRNGNEKLSRVYLGSVPQAVARSNSKWKKYSEFKFEATFAEVENVFYEFLNINGIKPTYFDSNSHNERLGVEIRISADMLSRVLK